MNKFICIGRVTKDIELTTTNSGVSVAKFSIAVDRKFKNDAGEKVTDFFNVVAWKNLAETIGKFCKKGNKIALISEIQTRSYDAQDGTKRYITELKAEQCEFLDTKAQDNEQKNSMEQKPIDDDNLPF